MSATSDRSPDNSRSRWRRLLVALVLTLVLFAVIGTLVVLSSVPQSGEPVKKKPSPQARQLDRQGLLRPAPTAP